MVPRRRVDRTMAISLQHGQAAQLIGLQAICRTVVLAFCSCPPIHSAQRRIQPLQRIECLLMAISRHLPIPGATSASPLKADIPKRPFTVTAVTATGNYQGIGNRLIVELEEVVLDDLALIIPRPIYPLKLQIPLGGLDKHLSRNGAADLPC